jgi:hypothetical protein|tara:strand:+ start:9878 stop:10435 length:558 start_codon:yes stop_codon:yes gene_type:complete
MRFWFILVFAVLVSTTAQSRNEYLNDGGRTCQYGQIDLSIEGQEDGQDYRHISPGNDYDSDSNRKSLRLSFRKFLGITKKDCDEVNKIQKENANLRQELEMLKVCSKYADRELPPQFSTVEKHCKGLRPRIVRDKKETADPLWDEMKEKYLKANPGNEIYDPKAKKPLKMPPEGYVMPEPKTEEQ